MRVDTASEAVGESVAEILGELQARGYLRRDRIEFPLHQEAHVHEPVPAPAHPHGGTLEVRLAEPARAAELRAEAGALTSVELDAWALSDLELLAGGARSRH